ncbi:MAG: hypothetical protein LBU68_02340 [Rickettsiales bacterium]|nr:hypothetical protein [Rickettsiales bacterium]
MYYKELRDKVLTEISLINEGCRPTHIRLSSPAGYGILQVFIAMASGLPCLMRPNEKDSTKYMGECMKISRAFVGFSRNHMPEIQVEPYYDRSGLEAKNLSVFDPVDHLKNFTRSFWATLAEFSDRLANFDDDVLDYGDDGRKVENDFLNLCKGEANLYENWIIVPSKNLTETKSGVKGDDKSENRAGVNLHKQNVPQSAEFFNFLKKYQDEKGDLNFIYGGHFNRKSLDEIAEALRLCDAIGGAIIPGNPQDEDSVFGIRGVPHARLFPLYSHSSLMISVANTTNWLALFRFPSMKQIILVPKGNKEGWDDFVIVFGIDIIVIEFDSDDFNADELRKEIEDAIDELMDN